MEKLMMEQTLSPHTQINNPRRKIHPHYLHHQLNISRQASRVINQNFAPFVHKYDINMNMIMHGGVPFNNTNNHPHNINTTPFHMSSSLPPYLQHLKYSTTNNHSKHFMQPPLLPLPVASYSPFRSLSGLGRSQSLSPHVPRKHTHKKISPQKPKKENKNSNNNNNNNNNDSKDNSLKAEGAKTLTKDTVNENEDPKIVGPDPKSHPKDVTRMLMGDVESVVDDMEKFSGSIFSIAPPPSSLPLPKFSLRQPKLSCSAEAAVAAAIEVDSDATDSLRRMLKLR